jgi:formate dehydrogenase accessory protein FdhE
MAQTPATDPQREAILQRLGRLAEQKPELAELIAFYRTMLPLLREAQRTVEPFSLAPQVAQQKLRAGLPLLLGEALPLDLEATQALFIQLCQIIEEIGQEAVGPVKRSGWSFFRRGQPDAAQLLAQAEAGNETALRAMASAQIRQAVEQGQLDLGAVWGALAAGETQAIQQMARELQLDEELLRTLAQNSLKPALRVWAKGLQGQVDLEEWRRGSCPMCGSAPALAEIQGKEGARHLRCTLCGADWSYPRLQCVFCNTRDHRRLGYLSVEEEAEKYSLQVCEACRGYIKVIITFEPTPADLLPVEDLATLHLDLIAAERQYTR